MVREWVVSAYIPRVQKKPTNKKRDLKRGLEDEVKNDASAKAQFSTPQNLIYQLNSNSGDNNISCSIKKKVF